MSTQRDELLDTVRIEVFEAVVSISDGYHPRSEDDHAIIHKAAETIMSAIEPRKVVSIEELEALPVGTVIWYSLRYDGQAMYSVMEKGLDGTWLSAMDPEDDYAYKPLLPATVLFTPEATA